MFSKHLTIAAVVGVVGAGAIVAGCGSAQIEGGDASGKSVDRGAQLFYERCSGCHTLSSAASEGSATKIHGRERVDGPNFDQRKETAPQVLFAIRNGGFSGAIMPQNIVVGEDAEAVANFLAEHSGKDVAEGDQPASK